jgi:sphingolipid delta-4 desaturase
MKPELAYDVVDYPEPHLERTRKLLSAHPEVRALFGHQRSTALFVFGVVALQVAVAVALAHAHVAWWAVLVAAWCFGAFADHALWTLIHECTHNLVFKRPRNNALLQIFANLPIVFPAAISFRKFHLLHHRFQGDPELDADLASPFEAKLIGNSVFGKAFWELTFFAWQAARVPRLKRVQMFDGWYALNLATQIAFVAALWWFGGFLAVLYVLMSSIFSIGLHPLGARWIQEHFLTSEGQETWSYYGPLNTLAFNVGYHNEHHDLMMVPWSRLPKLKAIAPEFYDSLVSHRSWTKLWLRFLFDPKLSLYSRRIRKTAELARPADTRFTEAIAADAKTHAEAA